MILNSFTDDPYFKSGEKFGQALAYFAIAALGIWFLVRMRRKNKK